MSFGISKAANGAPVSGKAQQLSSNASKNQATRGSSRPGQSGRDSKGPGR